MKKEAIKNKKMTIDGLAVMIAEGREETSDLAIMVAKGFESVHKEMGEFKNEVKNEINEVKEDILEVKENLGSLTQEVVALNKAQDETNRRLASIERKQTGILSSLDETVTRSEFQVLAKKVAVLEKRR